jgi:phenylacetaldehyde dehydrogenase
MAEWATKLHGNTYSPSVPYVTQVDIFSYTLREPVGVVGAITPATFPVARPFGKSLRCWRPDAPWCSSQRNKRHSPHCAFAALFDDAGLPPGVVSIVTGLGHSAGAALVDHPGMEKIAFTGSTEVGQIIAARAGSNLKRCTLELGGKSAMLVMRDAEAKTTIPGTAMGLFKNHGQYCCAGSRLYVQGQIRRNRGWRREFCQEHQARSVALRGHRDGTVDLAESTETCAWITKIPAWKIGPNCWLAATRLRATVVTSSPRFSVMSGTT